MNAYEEFVLSRQEAFEEGKAEGRAEGESKASCFIAMKLKEAQVPYKTISESTGLSIEEIEKL